MAPAGACLVAADLIPGLSPLAPIAGLAILPAFSATPLLAYSLFVPDLLVSSGQIWSVILILTGITLSFCLPLARVLSFWPLLALGLTFAARLGGLADTALAASEAFILSLALNGLPPSLALLRAPLPPLAGFLPFWLALHGINGLSGLSPAWTAGAMILTLLTGGLMVRAWLFAWDSLAWAGSDPQGAAGSGMTWSDHAMLPALTLGLCLSICPGLLLGAVRGAALDLAGASPEIWRHWPVWSIAGGDGAFWYPALVFLIPALVASALISSAPLTPYRDALFTFGRHGPTTGRLPAWPPPNIKLRFPWGVRRLIASNRSRRVLLTWLSRMKNDEAGLMPDGSQPPPAGGRLRPDVKAVRQGLAFWLVLLAIALAWLGWTA
ncbi:hypothetical protein AA0535_1408 [Asaia krungthepensis NRIC 0535]|uniref:NADH:quinone oxidoreductase/Mrp antiporter membrane subunit domain-containing protein n=2 Tax=Asaia krungthepensis TaxID=220990 RepID=A0ABQ0Q299_9PROT|nr:hypothetical protein AA0535_1408 [Asaia krungthepensis NRIC 0535]